MQLSIVKSAGNKNWIHNNNTIFFIKIQTVSTNLFLENVRTYIQKAGIAQKVTLGVIEKKRNWSIL